VVLRWLGRCIEDALAILALFVMSGVALSSAGVTGLISLVLASIVTAAVVVGWRWSAATRKHMPRPMAAVAIVALGVLVLFALYRASTG
jgi:hypothetical protein